MRYLHAAIFVLFASLATGCYAPQAGSVIPTYDGARLYRDHCSTCHGKGGAGDGPFVSQLNANPSDLRTLAERNNGVFPRIAVVRQIDGRDLRAVHGSRDMPVWGWYFRREGTDYRDPTEQAMARIDALVDHLESIQLAPR